MRYPLKMTANLARYVATKRFRGTKKFPMVMMLEPLHACNLTCTGCGRIREYKSTINEMHDRRAVPGGARTIAARRSSRSAAASR